MKQGPRYVYRFFAPDGALLYVGSSRDPLGTRLRQHKYDHAWMADVAAIAVAGPMSLSQSKIAEGMAIAQERPKYNKFCRRGFDRRLPAVAALRATGKTWQEIGNLLGLTRQRAHQIGVSERATA